MGWLEDKLLCALHNVINALPCAWHNVINALPCAWQNVVNPNQDWGGGWNPPPPLDVSRDNFAEYFFAQRAFANRAYRSEVTLRYVIKRRLKIWDFFFYLCTKHGKWLFVLKNPFWALKVCYLP